VPKCRSTKFVELSVLLVAVSIIKLTGCIFGLTATLLKFHCLVWGGVRVSICVYSEVGRSCWLFRRVDSKGLMPQKRRESRFPHLRFPLEISQLSLSSQLNLFNSFSPFSLSLKIISAQAHSDVSLNLSKSNSAPFFHLFSSFVSFQTNPRFPSYREVFLEPKVAFWGLLSQNFRSIRRSQRESGHIGSKYLNFSKLRQIKFRKRKLLKTIGNVQPWRNKS